MDGFSNDMQLADETVDQMMSVIQNQKEEVEEEETSGPQIMEPSRVHFRRGRGGRKDGASRKTQKGMFGMKV
jgi:hypothetical protein